MGGLLARRYVFQAALSTLQLHLVRRGGVSWLSGHAKLLRRFLKILFDSLHEQQIDLLELYLTAVKF